MMSKYYDRSKAKEKDVIGLFEKVNQIDLNDLSEEQMRQILLSAKKYSTFNKLTNQQYNNLKQIIEEITE